MKITKATLKRLIKEELGRVMEMEEEVPEEGPYTDDERDAMSDFEDMEASFRDRVFKLEDQAEEALAFIDQMRNVTLEEFLKDEFTDGDIQENVITNLEGAIDEAEGLMLLVQGYMKDKGISIRGSMSGLAESKRRLRRTRKGKKS